MKTVTISEARRHLSKLMDEVRESGQEIVATRREEEVCKIKLIALAKEKAIN